MRSSAEIVAFVLVFAAVASIAHGLGYRGYVKPLLDRQARIRAQIARVNQSKTWVRGLNGRVKSAERKIKALEPALEELSSYMLRDEGDRLRVSIARDHAAKDFSGLVITPSEVEPPAKLSFQIPVNPNEQLNRLKQQFMVENPRVQFPRWAVEPTVEVVRYSERIGVEAPLSTLLKFLMRLESESLFVHVTELKLQLPDPETPENNLCRAQVQLSTLSMPVADAAE